MIYPLLAGHYSVSHIVQEKLESWTRGEVYPKRPTRRVHVEIHWIYPASRRILDPIRAPWRTEELRG